MPKRLVAERERLRRQIRQLRKDGLSDRAIERALGLSQGLTRRFVGPRTVDVNVHKDGVASITGYSQIVDVNVHKNVPHISNNSGDNEWYTPVPYIRAARAVMGGIDLDPASTAEANAVVRAARFYTEKDDGLTQPWTGRVWMNPPYAQPWIARFCERLVTEHSRGGVTEACVLVNNATETRWFQALAAESAARCEPQGRVRFWHPRKEATPLQGQVLLYLGQRTSKFKHEFERFGLVR
jgi:ParB family chromosome partitioning protein